MDNNLYIRPMDPDVIKDTSGKCPKCGMDLVPKKQFDTDPETYEN